jgi:hypothetical protein
MADPPFVENRKPCPVDRNPYFRIQRAILTQLRVGKVDCKQLFLKRGPGKFRQHSGEKEELISMHRFANNHLQVRNAG